MRCWPLFCLNSLQLRPFSHKTKFLGETRQSDLPVWHMALFNWCYYYQQELGFWKGKIEYFGKEWADLSSESSDPKGNFVISAWIKFGLCIDRRKLSQYVQGVNLSFFSTWFHRIWHVCMRGFWANEKNAVGLICWKSFQTEGRDKAAKYWPQGRCGKKAALCPWLLYVFWESLSQDRLNVVSHPQE